jgi:hypothetical protein
MRHDLLLLSLLAVLCACGGHSLPPPAPPVERVAFVAADEGEWDYAPGGMNQIPGEPFDAEAAVFVESGENRIGRVYKNALYHEYLMGMGTEVDLHTPHWHGQTVLIGDIRPDVAEILPASMVVADKEPDNPGIWLLQCHVNDHIKAGMLARFELLP